MTHKDKIENYYTRELKPDGSLGLLLQSQFIYDGCGRIDTTESQSLLNTILSDNTHTFTYDNADNLILDVHLQKIYGQTHNIDVTRTIDFAGRPLKTRHEFDNIVEKTISQLSYTDKNQIAKHEVGHKTGGYLQSCDYTYRGNQLLNKINDPFNPDTEDLFHLQLKYDTITDNQSGKTQFNGNIVQSITRVKGMVGQSYVYEYDTYSRIKGASSARINSNTGSPLASNRFNTAYEYDLRGNIMSLDRYDQVQDGSTAHSYGLIDSLSLVYSTGTNKLLSVVDDASSDLKNRGAKESSDAYIFDENGNMIKDGARGTTITYNHLNLPSIIDFGGEKKIEFTYNADGSQLRKVTKSGTDIIEDRHYIGPAEYKDGELVEIMHDEGRIAKKETCNQNQYLAGILEDTETFTGDNIISSSSVIPSGTTFFDADQSIILTENFEVQTGKVFEAEIVDCITTDWSMNMSLKTILVTRG